MLDILKQGFFKSFSKEEKERWIKYFEEIMPQHYHSFKNIIEYLDLIEEDYNVRLQIDRRIKKEYLNYMKIIDHTNHKVVLIMVQDKKLKVYIRYYNTIFKKPLFKHGDYSFHRIKHLIYRVFNFFTTKTLLKKEYSIIEMDDIKKFFELIK